MEKTVESYIAGLTGWQREVVSELRAIIRQAAPEAGEVIKWSQPVYETNGPFCHIKVSKNHVNFGFWRGVELPDPEGLLRGSGEKMRHVRLTGPEDIHRDAFAALVQAALKLNLEKGDPTKAQ